MTSLTETSKLDLPLVAPAQAQKHIVLNEALIRLEAGVHLRVIDRSALSIAAPLLAGEAIIFSDTPDPDWTAYAGQVVAYGPAGPIRFNPFAGLTIWDEALALLMVFDGADWVSVVAGLLPLQSADQFGINIVSTPEQRLAVASDTTLFTHDGTDHRMTLNRAGATDTVSLIFQTNYTGSAELGLSGQSGFALKTSPDGAVWTNRLTLPDGFAGTEAPAFRSARVEIADNAVATVPTPASGGMFMITLISDTGFSKSNHSGLFAYDAGHSLSLDTMVALSGLTNHESLVLDGSISSNNRTGLSVASGALNIENRTGADRSYSVVFLG